MTYESKTDQELKSLAFDIVSGQVFYDQMIHESEVERIMPIVFMPIGLMQKDQLKVLIDDDVAMFYEYFHKSMDRGINGYPTFMSCRMLDKTDKKRLVVFIKEVNEFKNQYKEEIPQDEY